MALKRYQLLTTVEINGKLREEGEILYESDFKEPDEDNEDLSELETLRQDGYIALVEDEE